MKKSVRTVYGPPRIVIPGAESLTGWAVRYVSGMEEVKNVKPGYWLARWQDLPPSDAPGTVRKGTFQFTPDLQMCFDEEAAAKGVVAVLRDSAEVAATVVRIVRGESHA